MFVSQDTIEFDSLNSNNCSTTTDSFVIFHPINASAHVEPIFDDVMADETKDNVNVSHLKTLTLPKDWDEQKPKLIFPKTPSDDRYKMAGLHFERGIFIFNFLRSVLSVIQPYDMPLDLLRDTVDNRVTTSKFISQFIHIEAVFLALVGVCCLLACVIPGTELWLACRPIRDDYKPSQHPRLLAFFLSVFAFVLGLCMVTMTVCNEAIGVGIEKIPLAVETALQDFGDYHTGSTTQLRQCLTRSLDVATEAILADLDNVEELLGKPVQVELSTETGLDVALDALLDVANGTQELSLRAEALLKEGERARELGEELSREANELRRQLEAAARNCPAPDRPLCAILNPSGLHLALELDRLLRDDRLLRLRGTGRENLTEAGRQARGEYLYVPHHVARTTLDARNQIRQEINAVRVKIIDEAKHMESSNTELTKQLKSARKIANYVIPYINIFEEHRWFVGLGTILCVFFVWSLLVGALCCRCGTPEGKVRATLLCGVLTSCVVSVVVWAVFLTGLAVSSQTEMLICRPLHDPEFRTLETILETEAFLGKPLSIPLKDLFNKCQQNEAAYPAFQLGSSLKLEQLTAHWTWSGFSKALQRVRVDLKGLRILTPNLQQRLQSLLYACGPNLTEHRIMIQGPILNRDLSALSDQVVNVARQLKDQRTARDLEIIASSMRNLLLRQVKPLMKMQDELVYQLAGLELQLLPLQRQVNQSISHLKTIQYYIDNRGEMIAQLNTKLYIERLSTYLDQWRSHVLAEMGSGVARCRPLWDILHGLRLLLCQHVLGPMNGFWFATLLCAIVMIVSTPTAHCLALVYRKQLSDKETALLPSRTESPDTVVIDRETWRTPDPPPPQDGW